jgi:signal transduction histidine kinase
LVNNAVKFTECGSVAIACTAGDTHVEVAVRDTGIGIKEENMGLLFEAFRQVDGSARRHFEGSGLGLHLCKRLLGLLNGDIRAESEFGRGSCFTFRLPLSAGEAHETQSPTGRGQRTELLSG